jgi:RimJ/RimL family protein N-acetyltransferase
MAELRLPDPPLSDGAVTLRGFTLDDIAWITEGCNDPAVARFTGVPAPYTAADARDWIGGHADERACGEAIHLAVVEADGGAPLGSVGLMGIDWDHLRGDVGYWIGPWGRGHEAAPRAVRLLAAHGFEALGLQRIEIVPYADNPASQRVAEKAGATREGVLRSYFVARGTRHDCVMYSLLPDDLPPGGAAP